MDSVGTLVVGERLAEPVNAAAFLAAKRACRFIEEVQAQYCPLLRIQLCFAFGEPCCSALPAREQFAAGLILKALVIDRRGCESD